ncbi:MAG: hypothetical protein PHV60_08480 [bacterium]|nr:hypothetical protein [bacterium]
MFAIPLLNLFSALGNISSYYSQKLKSKDLIKEDDLIFSQEAAAHGFDEILSRKPAPSAGENVPQEVK